MLKLFLKFLVKLFGSVSFKDKPIKVDKVRLVC